jgi:esterase/lipase superfamily enzyme
MTDNFRRELGGWYSPRLDLHMPLASYGHWGHALLLYPTAAADYLDCERFGLIESIRPLIEAGKVRVFSIDSINRDAWTNNAVPMHEKAYRQVLYSGYVEEELVPHIRHVLQDPHARIATCGASFGAFHAANQFFRRPDLFDCLIGMSGLYDLAQVLWGYSDPNCYFNNPSWFVPNLREDSWQLDFIRHRSQIHLLGGQGAWERPQWAIDFSHLLASRSVPHNLDLWGTDMPHDWPTWRRILPYYIGERLGW